MHPRHVGVDDAPRPGNGVHGHSGAEAQVQVGRSRRLVEDLVDQLIDDRLHPGCPPAHHVVASEAGLGERRKRRCSCPSICKIVLPMNASSSGAVPTALEKVSASRSTWSTVAESYTEKSRPPVGAEMSGNPRWLVIVPACTGPVSRSSSYGGTDRRRSRRPWRDCALDRPHPRRLPLTISCPSRNPPRSNFTRLSGPLVLADRHHSCLR